MEEDEEEEEEEEEEEGDQIMDDKRPRIDNPFSKTEVIQQPAPSSAAPAKEPQLIQPAKIISVDKSEIKNMFATPTAVRSCVSLQDILKHRISKEEMSHQKAFANYAYGDPSSKLYLRNMAKNVTADDLLRLFGCFFDSDEEAKEWSSEMMMRRRKLEIRVMEGRMRGQAFVTFPSVELAREALVTVNGYLLKEKPIVIVRGALGLFCSVLESRRRERMEIVVFVRTKNAFFSVSRTFGIPVFDNLSYNFIMPKKSKKNQAQKDAEQPKEVARNVPQPAPKKEEKPAAKNQAAKPVNNNTPKNDKATPKEQECTQCQTCPCKGCCLPCRKSGCVVCRAIGCGVSTMLSLLMLFISVSLIAAGFVLFLIVRDVSHSRRCVTSRTPL